MPFDVQVLELAVDEPVPPVATMQGDQGLPRPDHFQVNELDLLENMQQMQGSLLQQIRD